MQAVSLELGSSQNRPLHYKGLRVNANGFIFATIFLDGFCKKFCNLSAKTKNWKTFRVVSIFLNVFFKFLPFLGRFRAVSKNLPRLKNGTSGTRKLNLRPL